MNEEQFNLLIDVVNAQSQYIKDTNNKLESINGKVSTIKTIILITFLLSLLAGGCAFFDAIMSY